MVNRLIEPTSGRILVAGEDIARRDPIALRRNIGYVIQKGGLFPHLTVAENIGLLCRLEDWPAEKINDRVEELLALVNLPPAEFAGRKPRELSGGQQQRVSVARSLAFDPPLILMDEPFGALDPITRTELHAEFLNLKNRLGKTILLVTHDLAEAFYLADRIALLNRGRIIQIGTETDLLENPANDFVRDFVGSHLSRGIL
jgi:osmoprotectant transport system ATP-binding protein